jgi:hypothetical protein
MKQLPTFIYYIAFIINIALFPDFQTFARPALNASAYVKLGSISQFHISPKKTAVYS